MFELITVKDAKLFCHVHRIDETAPWLLFSNSLLTNMSIFDAQFSYLSGQFNIIRYDQRGHGKSSVSKQLDFNLLAQDVINILDKAKVADCVFVGLSMGVPTGLATYDLAANRIKAMIFMDGQATSATDASQQWQTRIDNALDIGIDSFASATCARWLVSKDVDLHDRLKSIMISTPLEGFVASASALKAYDFSNVIPNLSVPVLTMAGANDGAMPEKMMRLAGSLINGRYVEIAKAGHVPCFEQPDAVNSAIQLFLDGAFQK